jgi:hypothetical protein
MDQAASRRLIREIVLDQTGGIELMNVSSRVRRRQSGVLRLQLGSTDLLESSTWFNLVIRSRYPHRFAIEYFERNTLRGTPIIINLINQITHRTTLTQPNSNLFLTNRNLIPVRPAAATDHAIVRFPRNICSALKASIVGIQQHAIPR